MFKKSTRVAYIATPFLSILFAACGFANAPEEEQAAELATPKGDNQATELGVSAAAPTWGNPTLEFCVSKNFSVPSCPGVIGMPCGAAGNTTVCKKPAPDNCLNVGLGVFQVTCQ